MMQLPRIERWAQKVCHSTCSIPLQTQNPSQTQPPFSAPKPSPQKLLGFESSAINRVKSQPV